MEKQGPQTNGHKAFKKLHDCISGVAADWEWLKERQFLITSLLNTFNTHYCNCITVYDPATFQFDSIFLFVNDEISRVDGVYMEVDAINKTIEFKLSLQISTKNKSEPEQISFFDPSIYDGQSLINTIFEGDVSDPDIFFPNNAVNASFYTLRRGPVSPYVVIVNNRKQKLDKAGREEYPAIDDKAGLFKLLGINPYSRDKLIPFSVITVNTKAPGRQARIGNDTILDANEKLLLQNFLFGPGTVDYFNSNTLYDEESDTHSFIEESIVLPWDENSGILDKLQVLANTDDGKKLIASVVNQSDRERMVFDVYGQPPRVQSIVEPQKTVEPVIPRVVIEPKVIPPVVIPSNKPNADITKKKNTQPQRKENNNVSKLRNLVILLKNVQPSQMISEFLALSRLLHVFNYFHCTAISLENDLTEIEPIYITHKLIVQRLRSVRMVNDNTFMFDFCDITGKNTSLPLEYLLVIVNAEEQEDTVPFTHQKIDDTVSYLLKLDESLFGSIHRYYAYRGMYNSCRDTNGLLSLIESDDNKKKWRVERKYFTNNEINMTLAPGNDLPLTKSNLSITQKNLLKGFLFSLNDNTKTDDYNNLKDVLIGEKAWVSTFKLNASEGEWNAVLGIVRTESPNVYNLLVPQGGRKDYPLPEDDRDVDIKKLIEDAPRAKRLYEAIEKLEKSVRGIKQENGDLKIEVETLKKASKTLPSGDIKKLTDANNILEIDKMESSIKVKKLTSEVDRLKKDKANLFEISKIDNEEFKGKFDLMIGVLDEILDDVENPVNDGKSAALSVERHNNVLIPAFRGFEVIADEKKKQFPVTEEVDTQGNAKIGAAILSEGMDVVSSKERFSSMIRDNVYKGKYNVEVIINGSDTKTPDLHMNFKHINTYTDENDKLVYGALCNRNSQQIFHTQNDNRLSPLSGNMTVRIKDERDRLVKDISTPFVDMPVDGHLYMLKTNDMRFYLTRSSDTTPLKVKMLIVDV